MSFQDTNSNSALLFLIGEEKLGEKGDVCCIGPYRYYTPNWGRPSGDRWADDLKGFVVIMLY